MTLGLAIALSVMGHLEREKMVEQYRITKVSEGNFEVSTKVFGTWQRMHTTPGFPTQVSAEEYIKSLTNPEVVGRYSASGEEIE